MCKKECDGELPEDVRQVQVGRVSVPIVIKLRCGHMCRKCWAETIAKFDKER